MTPSLRPVRLFLAPLAHSVNHIGLDQSMPHYQDPSSLEYQILVQDQPTLALKPKQ